MRSLGTHRRCIRAETSRASARTVVVALTLLTVSACASSSPKAAQVFEKDTSATMSVRELRIRVRDLARPLAGMMEITADRIMAETDDPELYRQALLTKTEAIPALFQALFRKDPGVALIDAAAFVEQLKLDFSERYREQLSEAHLRMILETGDEMERQLQAVYLGAGATREEVDALWTRIEDWARAHPINGNYGVRTSTSDLAAIASMVRKGGLSQAIAGTEEDLADFASRADLYAEFLPRQSRWQAELMLNDLLESDALPEAIERLGPVDIAITELPIDITSERQALIDDLRREGLLIGTWIRNERLETLDALTSEREAVLDRMTAERLALLDAVAGEREALLAGLRDERKAAFRDLEAMIESAFEQSRKDVIDHFFVRAAQLLAVVLPLVFLGAWIIVRFAGRRPS